MIPLIQGDIMDAGSALLHHLERHINYFLSSVALRAGTPASTSQVLQV